MAVRQNTTVLMSGADYFDIVAMNPFTHDVGAANREQAVQDFETIRAAIKSSGIQVITVDAPKDCQDGIFTANWGLCRGDTVILASLPNVRQAEMPYAAQVLQGLGKKVIAAPYHFSGQGDALACGNYLFAGQGYRTDPRMHAFLAETLGYEVISLQTVPELDAAKQPVINHVTGWPDSFFYDIDLAVSVLRPDLIAWCPDAFTAESQTRMRAVPIDKIEVSLEEAMKSFACNLLSNGETVIMSALAPQLKIAIESHGLTTIAPHIGELGKAGGYIRCVTLTLDSA